MLTARNVLLWLHIVIAVVTMGPFIVFDVVTPGLVRTGNAPALRLLERMTKVLGPSTMLIALAGVALVLHSEGYHFSQAWVAGGLVGYLLVLAIGVGVLSKTVTRAVGRIEAGEDASAEAGRLRVFGTVNVVLILTILWLMVAKPGL